MTLLSATEPDWSREAVGHWEWSPGRQLLRALRDHQRAAAGSGALADARRWEATVRHRFWAAMAGADIPLNARIAGGLLLPHPTGVVIHPDAIVGPNCLLFQQVTLGMGGKVPGLPRLVGHVDVGAGAKILGGITLGEHCKIGANAVVVTDVPPFATAVGVPAVVRLAAAPGGSPPR
jgi:serine O-acetyltransferase